MLPGIIIEIKAGEKKEEKHNLAKLAQAALEQIEEKKYDTELLSQGIKTIHKYGIAFANKDVAIRTN